MLPIDRPDRIHVTFDDHRLVANAGLILPVTLAHHLGLGELVDNKVDLGDAPGRANAGDKFLTLVASASAGGDCIDDALRAGGTEQVLGRVIKAPSTLGIFLRSFRRGHVRQLDRVSRELLAIAAVTGGVLMSRLRKGRANTVRGAAHFLRETVGRVRYAGARGQLTVRADSGFYAHAIVTVCREKRVRFSITVRQHPRLRNIIEAIPEEEWTPIPYWMEGTADVAETDYTPFESTPDAAPVRIIVRRVKPTPGSQLALFTNYSYHAFITDREGDTLELEADHRRHAKIENAIRDLKYGVGLNHLPPSWTCGRFAANAAWLAVQVMVHNLARWTGRADGNHQDPQAALLLPGRTGHPQGPAPHPASSPGLALAEPVQQRSGPIARPAAPLLTTTTASDHPPHYPIASLTRARLAPQCLLPPSARLLSPSAGAAGRQHPFGVATTPCAQLDWSGSRPRRLYPAPLIPCFLGVARSFRWIRA